MEDVLIDESVRAKIIGDWSLLWKCYLYLTVANTY